MKTKIQTVRLHAALIALALLVPALVAAPAALATDAAADTPLAVFRPGAPGEPNWTMLKLDVDGPGRRLQVLVDDEDVRCPFAWGFNLYHGEAPDAVLYSSLTIDFAYGHNGVRIHSSGPVGVDYDDVEHDGAEACPTGGGGIRFTFQDVPTGTLYLLQYKAGTPFEGLATLFRDPGVQVVAQSSGDRTLYLGSQDFEGGDPRVEVFSPPVCVWPSTNPETGFCDPDYRWAGGTAAGVDAGVGRSARITFHDRPYFFFGANTNLVGVTNATMMDPLGIVHTIRSSTGADAGPMTANVGMVLYSTRGRAMDHSSGVYVFDIRMNANVGTAKAVPWHLAGVDFHFPEEAR